MSLLHSCVVPIISQIKVGEGFHKNNIIYKKLQFFSQIIKSALLLQSETMKNQFIHNQHTLFSLGS